MCFFDGRNDDDDDKYNKNISFSSKSFYYISIKKDWHGSLNENFHSIR
jgi:hypothetical protein